MSAIRKFGYKLGKLQGKYTKSFLFAAILITILLLPGIFILLGNVEPSLEKVLPQDIEEVKVMNQMRSEYGADMLYIVLVNENNVNPYSPDTIRYIDSISNALRTSENVLEVDSIADVIKQSNNGVIPNTQNEIQSILDKNPLTQMYVSCDKSVFMIQIKTDTGSNVPAIKSVIGEINFVGSMYETKNPGFDFKVTGFNVIDQATFNIIISDFIKITGISFGAMVLFLLFYYRFSFKKTLYTLVIMIFSLIWTLGLIGYIGIKLNVVTMVSAAMIIALGSSYGINSVYHFYDDFLLQYKKDEAIAKFQEFLIIGLSGSALAEIAGFMALLFGTLPAMHDLGIILAIGIFFALFVSVVILPVFFFLLEKDEHSS